MSWTNLTDSTSVVPAVLTTSSLLVSSSKVFNILNCLTITTMMAVT